MAPVFARKLLSAVRCVSSSFESACTNGELGSLRSTSSLFSFLISKVQVFASLSLNLNSIQVFPASEGQIWTSIPPISFLVMIKVCPCSSWYSTPGSNGHGPTFSVPLKKARFHCSSIFIVRSLSSGLLALIWSKAFLAFDSNTAPIYSLLPSKALTLAGVSVLIFPSLLSFPPISRILVAPVVLAAVRKR